MPEHNRGRIVGVNGNLLTVEFDTSVIQNEVAFVILGDLRLKSEVIRVRGNRADLQVFESTDGIKVGDIVEFSGSLLSVTLGPGLLKQVFDGLQNPLPMLAEKSGFFLQRGVYLDAFDFQAVWDFTPLAEVGAKLRAGDKIGFVPEGIFKHYIMLPFAFRGVWTLESVNAPGEYKACDTVATVRNEKGETRTVSMIQE